MATKRKEMIFKLIVSDPKSGKSIQKEVKEESLVGKKIGDIIDGEIIDLDGYKLEIKGGSGYEGAPMVDYVSGMNKKYVWKNYNKIRVKKLVRGNTISPEIVQINTVIKEYGNKNFEEIFQELKNNNTENK
ncbi:30S ribosomal protein S6e [Nanobdella aerobiophila]|uniref:30S ribosomal protein S6e n=1 Tax=Nanobdella aerobiophila TaxID=2586965 RepID=A0A915SIE5_9ARCH|nr:S6e family ribosomal protein [Nanobdella aerobiophila]BBL45587.1 30S ribosomal protein S6e [Nanobdella aerobiophila]